MSNSSNELDFNILKIYKPVLKTNARYIDIWGGRGRGGSHFVTDLFLFKLITARYFRGYFMRSVFGDIRNSLFQDIKDRIEEKEGIELSDFYINENEMSITNPLNGNQILSKGFKKSSGSQTAKLKSIAGATDVAIEECEEVEEDDFNILDISLRTIKSDLHIYRVWNPPDKQHWLIRNYFDLVPFTEEEQEENEILKEYFMAYPKGIDDHLAIFSTYEDNRKQLNESFIKKMESFSITNPEYYFSNVKGYVSSGKKGRVFNNYQFYDELPQKGYYRIFGLDFGYSPDPTVLVELNINREQKELYIKEVHRGYEMSIEEIYTAIVKNNPNKDEVICDNAEKREYNALIYYGLNMFKSEKGKGSRGAGRGLVKNFKLFIHKDSKDYIEELEKHTWAMDANKMPTGKPIDGWDHGIDATVYGVKYYVKIYGLNINN